jgi:chromosomal replication initiator protein
MMEVGANCMSASQGCTDNMDVVQNFTEALSGRIGADRFRMWFGQNVSFSFQPSVKRTSVKRTSVKRTSVKGTSVDQRDADDIGVDPGSAMGSSRDKVVVLVRGQFALDRLEKNFLSQLRGAAMQACGSAADVELQLDQPQAEQVDLPIDGLDSASPVRRSANRSASSVGQRRGKTESISDLVAGTTLRSAQAKQKRERNLIGSRPAPRRPLPGQLSLPGISGDGVSRGNEISGSDKSGSDKKSAREAMTLQSFVAGPSNKLALTAATMVCETPGVASPLFICGPTGTGKTHLLCAIAQMLRRRHRMRRVVHLSAEQFTNDFIASVSNSGITSFRSRYRDIDALLIDDIQFLGSKKATLRELLYTIETLSAAGRPLIFSGLRSPTEIQGLTSELAGRMAAGLVCPVGPLDQQARKAVLSRLLEERCPATVNDDLIEQLSAAVAGDGRVISGLANSVALLSRMHGRAPSIDEVRTLSGDLLRSSKPVATLSVIESAVCEAFQLPQETLRGASQTRATTEPRMLAMYLARQMTSSAYAEIARHFGGKSHSTAIAAEKNVTRWLGDGKAIGRGHAAMSTREALDRVENLIRNVS